MRWDLIITGYGLCAVGIGLLMVAAALDVHYEYHRRTPPGSLDIIGRLRHAEPEDSTDSPGDSGSDPTSSDRPGIERDYVGRRRRGEVSSNSGEYVPRRYRSDSPSDLKESESMNLPCDDCKVYPCGCTSDEPDPEPDDDGDDDETPADPENFDGGYGSGSYFQHAQHRDD